MSTIVFFIFAVLAVAAAWGVVTSRNIVHSAFFLALTFGGVAGLYILMNAEFLAAVQLLIYAGAVSIMVVFAVMLTLRGDVGESNMPNRKRGRGALVAGIFFVVIAMVILTYPDWRIPATPWTATNALTDLSMLMFTSYMIPFEIIAFLLTMALIGAVILAKGAKESK